MLLLLHSLYIENYVLEYGCFHLSVQGKVYRSGMMKAACKYFLLNVQKTVIKQGISQNLSYQLPVSESVPHLSLLTLFTFHPQMKLHKALFLPKGVVEYTFTRTLFQYFNQLLKIFFSSFLYFENLEKRCKIYQDD